VTKDSPSTRWVHISDVPEPIRASMSSIFSPWSRVDLFIESTVALSNPDQSEKIASTVQSSLNPVRIPQFVDSLRQAHPALTRRDAFRAIAIFMGVGESHIRHHYYWGRSCSASM